MFKVTINGKSLTVANSQDLPGLFLKKDELIHLGDYDRNQPEGLYICSMTRGELYKYSDLNYDLIDFGIPIEYWKEAEKSPMVIYYGESGTFGSKVYDYDVICQLAKKVYQLLSNGEFSPMKVNGG
jgi:hypothetical protein